MSPSNIEILAYEDTPLGILCLRRRELLSEPGTVVTEITLNHEYLMSSLNTSSERALATLALKMHEGKALRVLVGGFGLGYTAREVLLSDRVSHVEAVEFLPQVINWYLDDMLPVAKELKSDPRFTVTSGDAYARLAGAPDDLWDIILIDIDHAPDERLGGDSSSFYTTEGLERAKKHLSPNGILGVWSYAESSPFADELRSVFDEVRVEPVTFHNQLVDEDATDWLFFARG
jgi:spermidine synthase